MPAESWTQSGKYLWVMSQILISSPGLWTLHYGIISHFSPHSTKKLSFPCELTDGASQRKNSLEQSHLGGLCLL